MGTRKEDSDRHLQKAEVSIKRLIILMLHFKVNFNFWAVP